MTNKITIEEETAKQLNNLKETYAVQSVDEVLKILIWKATKQRVEIILL